MDLDGFSFLDIWIYGPGLKPTPSPPPMYRGTWWSPSPPLWCGVPCLRWWGNLVGFVVHLCRCAATGDMHAILSDHAQTNSQLFARLLSPMAASENDGCLRPHYNSWFSQSPGATDFTTFKSSSLPYSHGDLILTPVHGGGGGGGRQP